MRRSHVVLLGIVLTMLCNPVSGSLIGIGVFTGQLSESWEQFPTTQKGDPPLPDPTAIMAGAALISHPNMIVFGSTAPIGLGSSGPAQPSDGAKAMSARELGATVAILFDQPVSRFGAFWGADTAPFDPSIGDPAVFALSFFDSANSLIGTDSFSYSRSQYRDGLLEWHGWSSSIPIKRVTYTEDTPVVDGLQADPVPEPAAFFPLAFGALARRRHWRQLHTA